MIRNTLLALGAFMALAGPANAQDATAAAYFERFDRYCIATGGDPELAGAAAQADGWIAAPQSMIDDIVNPDAPEAAVWLSGPVDTDPIELGVSASPEIEGYAGIKVRTCSVVPRIAYDHAELGALVETRLGMSSPVGIWPYSGTGPFADESQVAIGGTEAMAIRAQTTPFFMLNLVQEGGLSGLMLLRVGN